MIESKRYSSVPEMLLDSDDEEMRQLGQKLKDDAALRNLSRAFFTLRCKFGLTEEQMAEWMEIPLEHLQMIEHKVDPAVLTGVMPCEEK